MTDRRDWVYSVGPIDAAMAESFLSILQRSVNSDQHVKLLDHREGFVSSWDHASVVAAIQVLTIGLHSSAIPNDVRVIAEGLLDLLQFWITEEYEPARDSEDP
jgi:hypothetical protein